MAVTTSLRERSAGKRAALVGLYLVLAGIVVDRVSLFAWRHQVLRFYHSIRRTPSAPVIPLQHLRPPWLFLGSDAPSRHLDLWFEGVSLRADRVTLDERGQLTLVFVPPALAWSTRLYPRGSEPSRYHHSYTFTLTQGAGPLQCHLYSSIGQSAQPIDPTSVWPRVF